MTVNRKPTGRAVSTPAGLAGGAAAAVTTTLLGSFLTAKLLDIQLIGWDNSGYAVLLILMLSSWLGAMIAVRRIKRQPLLMGMGSGAIYFILLLCATALFFGGQYSGVGETGLLIFCGSLLGVFTGFQGKTGRKRRNFRRHNG